MSPLPLDFVLCWIRREGSGFCFRQGQTTIMLILTFNFVSGRNRRLLIVVAAYNEGRIPHHISLVVWTRLGGTHHLVSKSAGLSAYQLSNTLQ